MKPMRFLSVLLLIATFTGKTNAEELPEIPAGYSTELFVQAAIATGMLELLDPDQVTVPDEIQVEREIEFGNVNGRALHLDLYIPQDRPTPTPAILFIHGGAWKGGKRQDMEFYCVEFARRGYVTATATYRLSGEAPFPAAVHDVKCAVRWMRAHASDYDIDPNRIAVSGNSAGGHLSMMAGFSDDPALEGTGGHPDVSSSVCAVVNFYGPTDLTTDFASRQGVLHQFMDNRQLDEARDQYELGSPIRHLDANDPPTLTFHGTIDTVVPIAQADMLDKRMQELGLPHEYERYDGWPHAMDLAVAVNRRCIAVMERFFARYLKPSLATATENQ